MTIKNLLKGLKLAEGGISVILGTLVVVVIGFLLLNYFRGVNRLAGPSLPFQTTKTPMGVTPSVQPAQASAELPTTYKIERGDHLWKIALKFYGSGYNWIDIARENNLKGPDKILVGQELKIPKVAPRQPNVQLAETKKVEKLTLEPISDTKYTVVRGDNLWDIAVRAYQDGFKWPQIAKANKLVNPNLIHPSNVLSLPR